MGDREAPSSARDAPRRPAVRRNDPDVRRRDRLADQEIIVGDLEGAIVLVFVRRRLIRRYKGDLRSVRAPCKLLHALLHVGQTPRIAAVHRDHPDLPFRFAIAGRVGEECDALAVARPARRRDSAPLERQGALRTARNVDQRQLGVVAAILAVRSRNDEHD